MVYGLQKSRGVVLGKRFEGKKKVENNTLPLIHQRLGSFKAYPINQFRSL
jgi:hypothetical protein